MKTTWKKFAFLLAMMLAMSTFSAMAENQDPTQAVCVGNQPYRVDLSAVVGATYNWSITPGVAGVDWQINPVAGNGNEITVDWLQQGVYTLKVFTTANGCDGPPQQVIVTVELQPVGPQLAAMTPASPVCEGTDVSATFIPGTGGVGCSDIFEYSYDGLGVWLPYPEGSPIPTTGHTLVEIRGQRTGCTPGAGCNGTPWVVLATWNVTTTILATVDIVASADPVCEGTSVTYTANVTNGGTPTYEWHVNGGPIVGTNQTYTYVPVVGDVITCIVVANAPCVSPAPITGTFNPVVNPKPTTSGIYHN